MSRWQVVIVVALAACSRQAEKGVGALVLQRGSLAGEAPVGLSDLALDARGRLFGLPERDRALVPIDDADRYARRAEQAIPLVGVPEDVDTESFAWLPDGRLALGTETHHERDADPILFAQLDAAGVRVVDSLTLSYAPWGLKADENHGIEGLCVAGQSLVAAAELALEREGKRFAPIARYDLERRSWQHHLLELTTTTGRLSGMACRADGARGVTVVAIERHYGVARLVRFVMPDAETMTTVQPELVFDLGAELDPLPNFEGIVWRGVDEYELLTDNSSGKISGPTQWARVTRAGSGR